MQVHRGYAAILGLLKWPIALTSLIYLPAIVDAFLSTVVSSLASENRALDAFFFGVLSYLLLWILLIRRSRLTFLSTLEHEITHCLFAWLTLNKVTGLRVTLKDGGHMTYEGTPNWLIQTSPYFFPTISFLLLIPVFWFGSPLRESLLFLLGVSTGYHIVSTYQETHSQQGDFRDAGFIFVLCFLPGANIFLYLVLLNSMMEFRFSVGPTIASVYHSKWAPSVSIFFT
jgi:hypothetical protein